MSDTSISQMIAVALQNVERYGGLPEGDHIDTHQLLDAIVSERLVTWNERRGRYELTAVGHKWLIVYSRSRPMDTDAKRDYFVINLPGTRARQ
jgi:hypothetical protein